MKKLFCLFLIIIMCAGCAVPAAPTVPTGTAPTPPNETVAPRPDTEDCRRAATLGAKAG